MGENLWAYPEILNYYYAKIKCELQLCVFYVRQLQQQQQQVKPREQYGESFFRHTMRFTKTVET